MTLVRVRLDAIRSKGKAIVGYESVVLGAASKISAGYAWFRPEDYDALKRRYTPGPGTELKALLKTVGIVASPNCSCNKRAAIMDEKGCDWCEENIDQIDGWLAEEAKKRKLPYISLAGRTLIKLAIRRSRKKGNGT